MERSAAHGCLHMTEEIIGKLHISKDLSLHQLINLKDSSNKLGLKLEKESLDVLVRKGIIGNITEHRKPHKNKRPNSLEDSNMEKPRVKRLNAVKLMKVKKRKFRSDLGNKLTNNAPDTKTQENLSTEKRDIFLNSDKSENFVRLNTSEESEIVADDDSDAEEPVGREKEFAFKNSHSKRKIKASRNVGALNVCTSFLQPDVEEEDGDNSDSIEIVESIGKGISAENKSRLCSKSTDQTVTAVNTGSSPNIYSVLRNCGVDPDLISKMSYRQFKTDWQRAGPDARLMLHQEPSECSGKPPKLSLLILKP